MRCAWFGKVPCKPCHTVKHPGELQMHIPKLESLQVWNPEYEELRRINLLRTVPSDRRSACVRGITIAADTQPWCRAYAAGMVFALCWPRATDTCQSRTHDGVQQSQRPAGSGDDDGQLENEQA